MQKIRLSDLLELSVLERIQLVADLWDSVAAAPEAVLLTKAQKDELDRRLDEYHKNPDAGSPWELVKGRIRKGA